MAAHYVLNEKIFIIGRTEICTFNSERQDTDQILHSVFPNKFNSNQSHTGLNCRISIKYLPKQQRFL